MGVIGPSYIHLRRWGMTNNTSVKKPILFNPQLNRKYQ